MKTEKTILTIQQLCDIFGYADMEKLFAEADKANIVFEIAGTPHVYKEDWDGYLHKSAASQLSARSKSGKTLSETNQLGIINSNLKRLPESIRTKERKLNAAQALLKSATTDAECYSLRGEISSLKNDLRTHRENLKKAEEGQKRILAQRAAELDALEAEDNEANDSTNAGKEAASETNGK